MFKPNVRGGTGTEQRASRVQEYRYDGDCDLGQEASCNEALYGLPTIDVQAAMVAAPGQCRKFSGRARVKADGTGRLGG